MLQAWVLVIGLAGSYGDSIAAIPGFADQAQCQVAGQAWLDRVSALPSEPSPTQPDLWRRKALPSFLCFRTAPPTP